ncbi:chorismate mutase [Aquidulcibacter sp.]|uniref:chorismate mutase n=1 Tax=Aquidulcibacter sp. TaxID=2052990 RepID=UPI003BA6D30E
MNMPAPSSSAPLPTDMTALREAIDAIDGQLARLIAQRSGLARAIAEAKKAAGDSGFGWRPAREIDILRGLITREPDLDPALAAAVWRALIAANLAAQGGLDVVTTLEAAPWAKLAFGSASETRILSASEALMAAKQGARTIACLPWPTDTHSWWVDLLDVSLAGVHVCAASPQIVANGTPASLLLAHRAPEASGGDISLLAGPKAALAGYQGHVLSQQGDMVLIQIPGFIDLDEPLEAGVRLIGSFALA